MTKKVQEKAEKLKAKELQIEEKAKAKKLKADEAYKAKKERRMACIHPLHSHAVTTAWLCVPVCRALHMRMIPDIIGEGEACRGNKACCQRTAEEGER